MAYNECNDSAYREGRVALRIMKSNALHALPADFRKSLAATPKAFAVWRDITPLAKSEWICWITSGKKAETRNIRIVKALSKLSGGMRRPCCWAGCPHR